MKIYISQTTKEEDSVTKIVCMCLYYLAITLQSIQNTIPKQEEEIVEMGKGKKI